MLLDPPESHRKFLDKQFKYLFSRRERLVVVRVCYGDFYAFNSWEKLYLLFLEFTGICTFSVITGNITNLKQQRKIADIIEEKQSEIESFLFQIDIQTPKQIDDEDYDHAKEYIGVCYLEGIQAQLKEGGYFEELSPQLKDRLVFHALKKYYNKFFFFFNDTECFQYAPKSFVRQVLVNLDCQIFLPGIEIIRAREEVDKLYFVYKGAIGIRPETSKEHIEFILREEQGLGASGSMKDIGSIRLGDDGIASNPFLKAIQESVENESTTIDCLAVLPEGSFFGDYQILFNLPSNFTFYTMAVGETWVMSIKASDFLSICENFPDYMQFLQQRALLRRNHFKSMLQRVQEQIKVKKKEEAAGEERSHRLKLQKGLSIFSDSGRLDKFKRDRPMSQDLTKLDQTEQPIFKKDLEMMDINFTVPILRMFLQRTDTASLNSQRYMEQKFKRYRDFFRIVKGLERDEVDLNQLLEELKIYEITKAPKKQFNSHLKVDLVPSNLTTKDTYPNTNSKEVIPTLFKDSQKAKNETFGKQTPGQMGINGTSKVQKGILKGQTPIDEDLLEMEQEINRNSKIGHSKKNQ